MSRPQLAAGALHRHRLLQLHGAGPAPATSAPLSTTSFVVERQVVRGNTHDIQSLCSPSTRPTALTTRGVPQVGYTVSFLIGHVITAAVAFGVGAIVFGAFALFLSLLFRLKLTLFAFVGVLMGVCCRRRGAGSSSGSDTYAAYNQPLTGR